MSDDPIYCSWCREGHEPRPYCAGLVAAKLRLLVARPGGGLYPPGTMGDIERMDLEEGLRAAAAAGLLNALEVSVLVLRLAQGLDRRSTAAQLLRPSGRPVSVGHVSRVTKIAVVKLADWLNDTVLAEYPVVEEADEPLATPI